jgi:hypothetical protein
MRYPITKFMDGRAQWWYTSAVSNEPQRKKSQGVRSAERGGQGIRFLSPFAAEFDYRVNVCRVAKGAYIEGL